MNNEELVKIIEEKFGHEVFSSSDLRIFTKLEPNLQAARLHRLVKKGIIYHIKKGQFFLK